MSQVIRHNPAPFGGVQLVLVGDLEQLPPVGLPDLITKNFKVLKFFFEPAAPSLPNLYHEAGFQRIQLETMFRQSDPLFLRILTCAREGKPFDEWPGDCQMAFLERCVDVPEDVVAAKLCVTNREVDANNQAELFKLPEPTFRYAARFFVGCATGRIQHIGRDLDSDDKAKYNLSSTLEKVLETVLKETGDVTLRVGAVVMISNNISPHLYRGLIGTVLSLTEKGVNVQFPHGVELIGTIEVKQNDNSGGGYVSAAFMPLRLAWSITARLFPILQTVCPNPAPCRFIARRVQRFRVHR